MRHLLPIALASLVSLASVATTHAHVDDAAPVSRLGEDASRDAVRQGVRTRRAMSDAVETMGGKGPCDDPLVAPSCRDGRPPSKGLPDGAWEDHGSAPPAGIVLQVARRATSALVAREVTGSSRMPGDACLLALAGTVEVLGTDPTFGSLVRYLPPESASTRAPSDCAMGTVAFVDWRLMRSWASPEASRKAHDALGASLSEAADHILAAPR